MSALACERARLWAALAPDDRLTELESRALDVHLRGCPACRGFAGAVTTIADALRSTPLEDAPAVAVVVSKKGGTLRRATEVGAAAAVLAVAVFAGSTAVSNREPPKPPEPRVPPVILASSVQAGAGPAVSAYLEQSRRYQRSGVGMLLP